jgi:uncharacterized protein (DUF1501 family)
MSTALTEEQKVVHLLNRTSFGPTREAVQKVNRDLNLTTDFRTVCSEVISRHLGQKDLSKIFPGFRTASPSLGLIA